MQVIHDIAPREDPDHIMLVMLPGARDRPLDLVENGFVQAIRDRGLPVDVAVVDAHMDYYLERSVSERLRRDVITPARAKGYAQIWLLGVSLGGMGSIAYARKYVADVEGVILLAPFLGARGLITEVVRAGGLNQWQPGELEPDDDERGLLAWLKQYRADSPELPAIYLGYGTDDRYARTSAMLAERLPAERVATVKGGHDWRTWIHLWKILLDKNLFSARRERVGATLLR